MKQLLRLFLTVSLIVAVFTTTNLSVFAATGDPKEVDVNKELSTKQKTLSNLEKEKQDLDEGISWYKNKNAELEKGGISPEEADEWGDNLKTIVEAEIKKAGVDSNINETKSSIGELSKQVAGSGYDPSLTPKTLIPATDLDQQKCFNVLYALDVSSDKKLESLSQKDLETLGIDGEKLTKTQFLGCAIKTGMVHLWMIPNFIEYIINFLLSVSGLIAVLFVLVGGYLYMFGGIGSDKERGKNAIIYGIAGFIVALVAWVVVNAIQILVTS